MLFLPNAVVLSTSLVRRLSGDSGELFDDQITANASLKTAMAVS